MSVGGGGKEEGWQAAGLRFRNHGNGNNGHIQGGPGGQWRGAAKWKEWRGSVTALPSGEDLTFKNVRNDGAPCKTERGVPLVITTKQMRCGKTGSPSSMPCASAVEASGCESAGGGTSRYLCLSTLPRRSRDGRRETRCYIGNSGCRRLYQKGLRCTSGPFQTSLSHQHLSVGGVAVARIESCDTAAAPMARMGIRPVICQKVVNFIS